MVPDIEMGPDVEQFQLVEVVTVGLEEEFRD